VGQLARDAATLVNAKVDLARYQTLVAQNAIAEQQLATQDALVKSDEGVVVSDQAMSKLPESIWAIPISSRRCRDVPASISWISAISCRQAKPTASWW